MRLTTKLLSYLNRVFDKNPQRVLALRLSYNGGMTWRVENGILSTSVVGGTGSNLTVDLTAYRIVDLVNFLAAQPGYSVLYLDGSDVQRLSARALIDGESSISVSNGDHLYAYTSPLWAYIEAVGPELDLAEQQIVQMLRQMSTRTAEGVWLDEIGGYYGIPRLIGEADSNYGPRIITEVLRPRGNNVAMEAAIAAFTGQAAQVTDVAVFDGLTPAYNGLITHNSAQIHNSNSRPEYGLFDVIVGFDLLGADTPDAFLLAARDVVDRIRDAGTHLRSLSLAGAEITDDFVAPVDGVGDPSEIVVDFAFAETADAPTEAVGMALEMQPLEDADAGPADGDLDLTITRNYLYNASRSHDGSIPHQGGVTLETLS